MRYLTRFAAAGIALSLLSASVYPSQRTLVDQAIDDPADSGVNISACCTFIAQTFTAGMTGTLIGVSVDVISPRNGPFSLHVALRPVTHEGKPDSIVLTENVWDKTTAGCRG